MKNKKNYTSRYYDMISGGSSSSAQQIIPLLKTYIQPKSVVDVGCGIGTWLEIWRDNGIENILGIDGAYIKLDQLRIPKDKFLAHDLRKPIVVNKKFDFVMSMEVAEHIDPDFSEIFIKSLCNLGDVILFSAAIPGQGGIMHINEQYPEYWSKLFKSNGYTGYDCLRFKLWNNKKIDTCYRQNSFFFVNDSVKERYPEIISASTELISIVHPELYDKKEAILKSYKRVLRSPFHVAWHYLKLLVNGKSN